MNMSKFLSMSMVPVGLGVLLLPQNDVARGQTNRATLAAPPFWPRHRRGGEGLAALAGPAAPAPPIPGKGKPRGGEIIASPFDYSLPTIAAFANLTASSTFSIARRISLLIGQ